MLTADEQQSFLDFLLRGASPAGACTELGLSLDVVERTRDRDDSFREQLELTIVTLSQNVLSALYRTAMKGSVTAQKFWLENHPPPAWGAERASPADHHPLEELSDDELIELAKAYEIDCTD
ncbi:MAG: hypothetical protein ACKVT0_21530 [Planctomycetaceae bacterium]